MKRVNYKIIKNEKQYDEYCKMLEELVFSETKSTTTQDEIDLLTQLIEDYDNLSWNTPQ
jgi:HTH-type transcriptional regulator/antitoxin HigA